MWKRDGDSFRLLIIPIETNNNYALKGFSNWSLKAELTNNTILDTFYKNENKSKNYDNNRVRIIYTFSWSGG